VFTNANAQVQGSWLIMNNLASLLNEHGNGKDDLNKSLSLANKVFGMVPEEPAVLDTLGWAYYRMGQYDKARVHIEKAFTKEPMSPEINFHLGMTLFKAGQKDEAKTRLEAAVKQGKNFPGKQEAEKALQEIGRT